MSTASDIGDAIRAAFEAVAEAIKRAAQIIKEILRWLARRIREAGAAEEEDTRRDGFLSYAGESHPIGYGIMLGFAIAAPFPRARALILLSLAAREAGRWRVNRRVLEEIRSEPQYFGPALVATIMAVSAWFGGVPAWL